VSGGELPHWRGDGKEIFYVAPGRKMTAVAVKAVAGAQPSFTAEAPQALFEARLPPLQNGYNNHPYAVTSDGKRFLVMAEGRETTASPLMVVVNWLAAVKR
jgi:eukaryotic-like serine/threonine-protein kinase